MIVLTKDKLAKFYSIKEQYQSKLDVLNCDYIPIEIKGDLFVLPDECLEDKRFLEFYGGLVSDKSMVMEIRPVDKNELKVYLEPKETFKEEVYDDVKDVDTKDEVPVYKNKITEYCYKFVNAIKSIFS